MEFNMQLFITALGLAFVLEGAVYFLGARAMSEMLRVLAERPHSELRLFGGLAIAIGLFLIWIVQ